MRWYDYFFLMTCGPHRKQYDHIRDVLGLLFDKIPAILDAAWYLLVAFAVVVLVLSMDILGFDIEEMSHPTFDQVPRRSNFCPSSNGISFDAQRMQNDGEAEGCCPICKDAFEKPVRTRCGQVYCSYCIRNALSHSDLCPLCRKDLFEPMMEDLQTTQRMVSEGAYAHHSSFTIPELCRVVITASCVLIFTVWSPTDEKGLLAGSRRLLRDFYVLRALTATEGCVFRFADYLSGFLPYSSGVGGALVLALDDAGVKLACIAASLYGTVTKCLLADALGEPATLAFETVRSGTRWMRLQMRALITWLKEPVAAVE